MSRMVCKQVHINEETQNFEYELQKSNPITKEVRTPKFKPQVVKPKKGKGSYKRQKGI